MHQKITYFLTYFVAAAV